MIFDTFVSFGNLSLRTSIFAAIVSLLLSLLLAKILPQKFQHHFTNETLDLFFSLFIVFIIAWKLSPLLIQPELWNKPLMLIYIQGIGTEVWLAGIITMLFLMWKVRKNNLPILTIIDSLTLGLYLFLFFYNFFVYTPGSLTPKIPLNIYREIIVIGFLIYVYKAKFLPSGKMGAYGLIIIGGWEFILSLLKTEPSLLIYFLTLSQWFSFVCLFTGIYLLYFKIQVKK